MFECSLSGDGGKHTHLKPKQFSYPQMLAPASQPSGKVWQGHIQLSVLRIRCKSRECQYRLPDKAWVSTKHVLLRHDEGKDCWVV